LGTSTVTASIHTRVIGSGVKDANVGQPVNVIIAASHVSSVQNKSKQETQMNQSDNEFPMQDADQSKENRWLDEEQQRRLEEEKAKFIAALEEENLKAKTPESWAIAELMGHVALAGRITKPGEYGGLWQIDIPVGHTFRTEFFGSQSVYRIRMVSEEIARAYAPRHEVLEYNAPIITREEHQEAMERASREYSRLQNEVDVLRRRLTAVNALPAGRYGDTENTFGSGETYRQEHLPIDPEDDEEAIEDPEPGEDDGE
jgi:hypothetical protein